MVCVFWVVPRSEFRCFGNHSTQGIPWFETSVVCHVTLALYQNVLILCVGVPFFKYFVIIITSESFPWKIGTIIGLVLLASNAFLQPSPRLRPPNTSYIWNGFVIQNDFILRGTWYLVYLRIIYHVFINHGSQIIGQRGQISRSLRIIWS